MSETKIIALQEQLITLQQQHIQDLKQKEAIIEEKDKDLKQKDAVIEEKDNDLKQKDAVIEEKDNDLKQKDAVIEEKDNDLKQKDAVIEEKDKDLKQKDAVIEEKDAVIEVKDKDLKQKDARHREERIRYHKEVNKALRAWGCSLLGKTRTTGRQLDGLLKQSINETVYMYRARPLATIRSDGRHRGYETVIRENTNGNTNIEVVVGYQSEVRNQVQKLTTDKKFKLMRRFTRSANPDDFIDNVRGFGYPSMVKELKRRGREPPKTPPVDFEMMPSMTMHHSGIEVNWVLWTLDCIHVQTSESRIRPDAVGTSFRVYRKVDELQTEISDIINRLENGLEFPGDAIEPDYEPDQEQEDEDVVYV